MVRALWRLSVRSGRRRRCDTASLLVRGRLRRSVRRGLPVGASILTIVGAKRLRRWCEPSDDCRCEAASLRVRGGFAVGASATGRVGRSVRLPPSLKLWRTTVALAKVVSRTVRIPSPAAPAPRSGRTVPQRAGVQRADSGSSRARPTTSIPFARRSTSRPPPVSQQMRRTRPATSNSPTSDASTRTRAEMRPFVTCPRMVSRMKSGSSESRRVASNLVPDMVTCPLPFVRNHDVPVELDLNQAQSRACADAPSGASRSSNAAQAGRRSTL
jgi:hypothetical protein